jgi:hypothetical protein
MIVPGVLLVVVGSLSVSASVVGDVHAEARFSGNFLITKTKPRLSFGKSLLAMVPFAFSIVSQSQKRRSDQFQRGRVGT